MSLLVYLDAGTINRIADGACTPDSVAALHAAMHETNAALVLSLAHVLDFCNGTTGDTQDRVARTVDMFSRRVLVVEKPDQVEQLALNQQGDGKAFQSASYTAPAWSPRMRPLVNFDRDVFADAGLMVQVSELLNVVPLFTNAQRLETRNRRERREAERKKPHAAKELREHTRRALEATLRSENAEQLRAAKARLLSHVPPSRRAAVEGNEEQSLAVGETFRRLGFTPERAAAILAKQPGLASVGFAGGHIRGGAERWFEVASVVAPGIALQVRLVEVNESNVGRDPTVSDLADRLHMQYLPYMDVSVIDANNLAVVTALLPRLRCPRGGEVLSDPGPDLTPIVRRIRDVASKS